MRAIDRRCRVAVLLSGRGRGSNLRALVAASRATEFSASIDLVVGTSDSDGCRFARAEGIETVVIPYGNGSGVGKIDAVFEDELDRLLRSRSIALVCLAGFMRILSSAFVDKWRDCILNIHPSLLPRLRGLDTHRRALAAGHVEHGCSVHIVTQGLDMGRVLASSPLTIKSNDKPESLAMRVLELEHRLYPRVLDRYARDIVLS